MRKTAGFLLAAITVAWAGVNGYARGITAFRQAQEREIAVHVAQQQEEEMQFRERLKGMTPPEKARTIAEHRNERQAKNDAFSEKLRRGNVAYLKARLLKNSKLTEADKEQLAGCFEQQCAEDAVFSQERYEKNAAFFEMTANDASLSLEQKKIRIREHFEARRSENWREGKTMSDR